MAQCMRSNVSSTMKLRCAQRHNRRSILPLGSNASTAKTYELSYIYDRHEDFVREMVGVDPERNTAATDNAEAIELAFQRAGEPAAGGGRVFTQPNTVAVLQKI